MKAIQISIEESLLERLDRHSEVKKRGRSAVLRQAASEFLARSADAEIANQYRAGYADRDGLGDEFNGWPGEGEWPDESV